MFHIEFSLQATWHLHVARFPFDIFWISPFKGQSVQSDARKAIEQLPSLIDQSLKAPIEANPIQEIRISRR